MPHRRQSHPPNVTKDSQRPPHSQIDDLEAVMNSRSGAQHGPELAFDCDVNASKFPILGFQIILGCDSACDGGAERNLRVVPNSL